MAISALAGGLALSTTAAQAATVEVANGAELAAAIVQANSDSSITRILCATQYGCDVVGSLPTYSGDQNLTIDGRFSTVDASAVDDADAFASVGSGNLKLIRMTFVGGLSGVYVEVPSDRTGTIKVDFRKVTVRDSILHGAHVTDPNKAVAGIQVTVFKSKFLDNGLTEIDQDGLYIFDSGAGSVKLDVSESRFKGNGSDGLGANETGGGSVVATVNTSYFLENGENPAKPGDPDDGMDIDEAGFGDVLVTATDSRFNMNFDDGLDLDERGKGSLTTVLTNVKANRNVDQGMTFDERDEGDLIANLTDSEVTDNDAESQNIDLRGDQSGDGVGVLTLDNTNVGNSWLNGMDLAD